MSDKTVKVTLTASAAGLISEMDKAGNAVRGVSREAKAAGTAASSSLSKNVASAGKAAATAFTTATVAGAALATSAFKAGVAYNGMQQASRAALTTILGGAQAANEQMDKLDEFARSSPFAKQVFIQAQQQLLGFGVAADKVIPTLDAIQNSVAAVGGSNDDIANVTDALAKMMGSGKLAGDTLNRLGLYGIDAASIIGESMGMTGAEIRAMASKPGGIPAEEVFDVLVNGLQEKFGGAADNVKNTWVGATDRIKGAWRDIGSNLAEPFVGHKGGGLAIEWVNKFADLMRAAQKQITPISDVLMPRMAGSFAKVTPALERARRAIDGFDVSRLSGGLDKISKAAPGLSAAGAAVFALGGNALGLQKLGFAINPVASGLVALVLASPEARQAVLDLLDALSPLVPVAGNLAVVLAGALSGAVGSLGTVVSSLAPLVEQLMNGVAFLADAFGTLPTPVQAAVVGLVALNIALRTMKVQAAVTSILGLVDSLRLVVMYAAGAGGPVKGVKAALEAIGIGAGGAEKATGRLGKALGGIGRAAVGIGVVATAVAILGKEMNKLNTGKLEVDLAKSSDAARDLDAAINDLNEAGFGQGATNVRSMGDALKYTFNASTVDGLLNATEAILSFGQVRTSDISVAGERLKEVDAALSGMIASGNSDKAKELMESITAEAASQGISVEDLARKFPLYAAALANVKDTAGDTSPTVEAVAAATNLAADAADDAAGPTDDLSGLLENLGKAGKDAEAAIKAFKDAVDLLSGGNLALRAAQRGVADSISNAKDAAIKAAEAKKKYGAKSREAADADRDWVGAIDGVVSKSRDELQALMDVGASADALKASYEKNRTEVDKLLEARGLHDEALKRESDAINGTREDFALLLEEYGKAPPEVNTKIVVDSTGAKVAIDNITTMLNRFNGRVVEAQVRTNYVTVGNAPMLPGTGVVTKLPHQYPSGTGPVGPWLRADGGPIPGRSPHPRADNIPVLATAGEWVIRNAAVAKAEAAKPGGLAHLNRTGEWPRFADGGQVGYPRARAQMAAATAQIDYAQFASAAKAAGGLTVNVTGGDPHAAAREVLAAWQWEQMR